MKAENTSRQILKQHQDPLSVEDQIQNLKDIGLMIEDEEYADRFLNNVSYFRSIKAYSLKLKPKNGQYHEGVTFEHIVSLYHFDSELRQLLFPQVEKIEISLRCRLSNYFSLKYGIFGYLDNNNFAEYPERFSNDIKSEIRRNKRSPFIRNFQNNYETGEIPFYALTEILSFGALSKFFKNMKSEDKKQIAKSYGVGYKYMESWIENIAYVRNVCAHYGRLYNAKFSKRPILYRQYSKIGIANDRLMGSLVCMKHLLSDDSQWSVFVDDIELLLLKYPRADIRTMGFPENWKSVLTN